MIKEDIEKVLSEFTDKKLFHIDAVIKGDAFEIRDKIITVFESNKNIDLTERISNIENMLSEINDNFEYIKKEYFTA